MFVSVTRMISPDDCSPGSKEQVVRKMRTSHPEKMMNRRTEGRGIGEEVRFTHPKMHPEVCSLDWIL